MLPGMVPVMPLAHIRAPGAVIAPGGARDCLASEAI